MGIYQYKARGMDGKTVSGTGEAADPSSMQRRLREKGLYCYEIKETGQEKSAFSARKLKPETAASFCRKLAVLLGSGIPVEKALGLCRESEKDTYLKSVLLKLTGELQKGKSLSQAMKEIKRIFPAFLVSMIEAGEASGAMDKIFIKLADHYEEEAEIRGKIQIVMIYPCILATVSIAAAVFLLTVVLPGFIRIFGDMELPLITRCMIALGSILEERGFFIAGFCGILALIFYKAMENEKIRIRVHGGILAVPVLGDFFNLVYTARFALTFSALLENGVGVLKSLDIAGNVLGNSYIQKKLKDSGEAVGKGRQLSKSLSDAQIFTSSFVSIVAVGEEAGNLEQILSDAGHHYEKEITRLAGKITAILEPMMILIMGGMVGVIVLSIMIPIFHMYSQLL